jgi:hypothetical protein
MPTRVVAPVDLGRLVVTAAVAHFLADPTHHAVVTLLPQWLGLHARGICPTMSLDDQRVNRLAVLNDDDRVFTAWPTGDPTEASLWIITEHDRSSTCVLLPDDY